MTDIIKGSLVSVVFSIVGFSHTDVNNMFSYNGVPCLLDIIAGTGMILKALDEAIMCMNVGDEREILIPAADASQTARALGVRMRGLLKYELKVIRVVNTPVGATEIAQFFSKGTVALTSLSECRVVKKGPFNISRTYDMFEAVAISEEFRILETLCKEKATHNPSQSMTIMSDDEQNSITERSAYNPNQSVQISSIPFLSNNGSQYLLPIWPINVPKESFLPDLMRLAVSSGSRIIILFDSPEDWKEISKSVAEQKRKELNKDKNNELILSDNNGIKLRINGVQETLPVEVEVENSAIEISSSDFQIQESDLGSDISMAVESEETDATKESVLTWLRIATDPPTSSSSCRKFTCKEESQSDFKRSKKNTTNNSPHNTEKNAEKNAENNSVNSGEDCRENVTCCPSAEKRYQAGDNNIISDDNNNAEFNRGYRVALIRFSGWDRGSAPQGRLWDGFWKLYSR